MITNIVQRELKRRLPGIVESYGGIDNFLSYIREFLEIPSGVQERGLSMYAKASFYNYLNTVITYSNDIITISPWSLFVNLRSSSINETVDNESINIDEPYRVYTINGDFLQYILNHH